MATSAIGTCSTVSSIPRSRAEQRKQVYENDPASVQRLFRQIRSCLETLEARVGGCIALQALYPRDQDTIKDIHTACNRDEATAE